MRLLNWLYDKYVTFTYTAWLRPTARRGERLLGNGTQSRGRITGIRVRYSGDADSGTTRYEFAVDVTPSAGERFKAGIRQRLQHGDRVRLGMEVPVRHDDRHRAAIIDWPEMLRRWGLDSADVHEMGWKPLRKPPADGIDDPTLGKLKGERTAATLVDASRTQTVFGPAENWDLVLEADGRQLVKKRDNVPIYARHLIEPGTTLPVAVDGDKIRVDWPAAVEAQPGSSAPPAAAAERHDEPSPAVTTTTTAPSPEAAIAAAPVDDAVDGVSFDTWVAVEAGIVRDRIAPDGYDEYAQRHGVPPGAWSSAQAAWQARMTSDWTIGARFGEAYQAALKRQDQG
jgi:hypothetical protein